jgi:DNA polymerase III delta prime subunit
LHDLEAAENVLQDGKDAVAIGSSDITWSLLEVAFQQGTEVWYEHNGHKVGGTVKETWYGAACGGEYFAMVVQSLSTDGRHVKIVTRTKKIGKYLRSRHVDEFEVQRMTPAVKEELKHRGENFRKYCVGQHHMTYHGIAYMDFPRSREYATVDEFGKEQCGLQTFRADGRTMIDGVSFVRFNANYEGSPPWWATRIDESEGVRQLGELDLPDDLLWKTWPTLKGFSFKAKRWGEFAVESLVPVEYRTEAIDQLVMERERKDMVLALVEHAHASFQDIVDEKGGGCVFLLHGPPGVGKTLTAEATADALRRPLYAITVGELGSSVQHMEDRLQFTLELARIWDAVLLIDECDIFLERRDSDVVRNAMTGIFLRLLEYHKGILFLTSNRIKDFDPALNSRITVALHYPALDHKTRAQVWRSMLQAAEIDTTGFDIEVLAKDSANGRQIKNAVRFAQVMARRSNSSVSLEHCQLASKLAREFKCDAADA